MPTIGTVTDDNDDNNGTELTELERIPSSVTSEATCRICFEPCAPEEAARFDCECKNVSCHIECARRWFESRGDDTCEICLVRTNVLQHDVSDDGPWRRHRSWIVRTLCCCLSEEDEEERASMTLFDLFVCALATCAILFVSLFSIFEFSALRSVTMAYSMAVAVVLGVAEFLPSLRALGLRRRHQMECATMFAAMAILSYEIALSLSLSRLRDQHLRNVVSQRLSFAMSLAILVIPQVVMLTALLAHAVARVIHGRRYR